MVHSSSADLHCSSMCFIFSILWGKYYYINYDRKLFSGRWTKIYTIAKMVILLYLYD